jgi:hypothetical protein
MFTPAGVRGDDLAQARLGDREEPPVRLALEQPHLGGEVHPGQPLLDERGVRTARAGVEGHPTTFSRAGL